MLLLIILSLVGIGFSVLLPKSLNLLFKFLIAPSLGIFIFTNLAIALSLTREINWTLIVISLIISILLSLTVFLKFKSNLNFHFVKSDTPLLFIVTATIIVITISYIWFTQTLSFKNGSIFTGGEGMYGDSALHAAYTSRLELGKFPIQNPLFAGRTLVYPVANDFLSAIFKITGLDFNLAFSLPQILFLIGFLALFYQIVKKFTTDLGFLTSLLILFLGWGIGALFFLIDWSKSGGTLWQVLIKDYTNNPEYNLHFHNILTGLILPERTFLPGLVLGLLMFLNFWEYFQERKLRFLLISGVILGTLPFWHTHTFIFFSITSLIFGGWLLIADKGKKIILDFGKMYLVTLIMALPFLFLFFTNHEVTDFIHTSFGWQNGQENILVFWFKNSLLTIPLAMAGLSLIKKDQRIFFVPAFIIFIIANLIIFQPWDWDNIKLLSWSFLFFTILMGIFLEQMIRGRFLMKLITVLIILISIFSGILSVAFQLRNKYVIYDKADMELADWTKVATGTSDVFIIDPIPNHPIPGLAGRLVYLGYPGHLWVHGINYGKREALNNKILDGDFSLINKLEVPISFVVMPKNNVEAGGGVTLVYQNQKYRVFKKMVGKY